MTPGHRTCPQGETMKFKLRRWIGALVGCVALACHASATGLIDDFFTDDASVQGRVTHLVGKPLPNIDVSVSIRPSASPYTYQPLRVQTDSLGRFQTLLSRVARLGEAPKPDTLSAQVVAIAVGPQYKTLPGGAFFSDSVPVSLQFVPHKTPAPPATVTVRLAIM